VIGRLDHEPVRPELIGYLHARIAVGESRWNEARRQLEAIYPHLGTENDLAYQANLLIGVCCEQLGDLDGRETAFRRAVALDPGRVEGHVGLAAAQEALGELDQAVDGYSTVIDRAPAVGTALARLLILRNLRRPPAQRDWSGVEQVLDRAARAMPRSPGVTIVRAEALLGQGQPGRARDLLRAARDQQPDQVELWTALALIADRHESTESALAILQQAESRLGARIELSLARIQHWAERGGQEAPRALAEIEREATSRPADDQDRLLASLFDASLRVGDGRSADRILGQLVRRRPRDPALRFSQFERALQDGDDAAMRLSLDQLRAVEDDPQTPGEIEGTRWRCGRARYLLWSSRGRGRGAIEPALIQEVRVLLAEAGSRRPRWPLVPLVAAEAEDLAGNPRGSLRHYLKAIESGVASPLVVRRTVQLLLELRQFEQAAAWIRKWREQGLVLGDPQFQRLAAEVSLRVDDPARALELARQSIAPGSKDYRDHLWLGQFYWAAGEPGKAGPELRSAVELGGRAPEAWITLVRFLARTGSVEEARAVIERARRHLDGDQAAPDLARCYAEVGDTDRARALFRQALASKPDDLPTLRGAATLALAVGDAGEAKSYLLRVMDLKDKSPDDAAWARRLLATVLSAGGAHLRAFELVGLADEGASYAPGPDEPVDEVRARAAVLANRNNRVARRAAIRILEFLGDQGLAIPDDRYRLAQLHEAEGSWQKAYAEIRDLLAGDPPNQVYLAHAARTLLRHGQVDEARSCTDDLEKLDPRAPAVAELRARLLKQSWRREEAVGLLKSFVRKRPDQVGNVAAVLEDLGEMAAAEELYRESTARSDHAGPILALARFLGRRGRLAEAVDLCEKASPSCPLEAVAEALVASLYAAPADAAQCRRAAGLIERGLAKDPNSAGLLFHLGNIRSLEGRYQEAVESYQRSLASDPANSGPLANLAWLLVRREGKGKGKEALELVARAMKLDGPTPDLLDTRAAGYLAVGRSDLAIRDLEDAIAVRATPLGYVHLSQAYLMADRRKDAHASFRTARAMGLDPERLSPLERENCERLMREVDRE
jgi:tetratricopeptide (TPR) repeat protein